MRGYGSLLRGRKHVPATTASQRWGSTWNATALHVNAVPVSKRDNRHSEVRLVHRHVRTQAHVTTRIASISHMQSCESPSLLLVALHLLEVRVFLAWGGNVVH
jgi:hypothetical protein